MDLQADIKWIVKELQDVKDPTFIEVVKDLLKSRKKMAQQPERISIEQYNKEIDEALEDVKAGRVHTHQEVKEMIKQWGRQ